MQGYDRHTVGRSRWRRWASAKHAGAALTAAGIVGAALIAAPLPAAAAPSNVLHAWGSNGNNEIGDGTNIDRHAPVRVQLPAGAAITDIFNGSDHSGAVTADGGVLTWGDAGDGQGCTGTTTDSPTPVPAQLPPGVTVAAGAGGQDHTLLLTSDGRVFACGSNDNGQLGISNNISSPTPVQVLLPAGVTATRVAAGLDFSLVVTADGQVFSFGAGSAGQLCHGTTAGSNVPMPMQLPAGAHATAVAGGADFSLVVTSDGSVWACGANSVGQLGDNTNTSSDAPVRVQLPAGVRATTVGTGYATGFAVTTEGWLFAWGHGEQGALGHGANENSPTPVRVQLPEDVTIAAVDGGDGYSVAVSSKGNVYSFGLNEDGQRGVGHTNNSNVPEQVPMPAGVAIRTVATMESHVLALPIVADPTTTELEVPPDPVDEGEPVTLTATVTCPAGTPTGPVIFREGTTELGTATLEDGVATLTVDDLPVGTHTVIADYRGDTQCEPSTSNLGTVTVVPPSAGDAGALPDGAGGLPNTGGSVVALSLVGGLLTLLGIALLVLVRPHRRLLRRS